jgi:hypothetical protein
MGMKYRGYGARLVMSMVAQNVAPAEKIIKTTRCKKLLSDCCGCGLEMNEEYTVMIINRI